MPPRYQRNIHAPKLTARQREILPPLLAGADLSALEPLKLLHQPHNRVAYLGNGKVLPDADARAAVEREVAPPGAEVVLGQPALGAEGLGVGAVDGGEAV